MILSLEDVIHSINRSEKKESKEMAAMPSFGHRQNSAR